MNILHTEESTGWGGQEIRILKEAEGMRARGHTVFFAVARGAQLARHAHNAGFTVYEFPFSFKKAPMVLYHLISIIRRHHIHLINTHSSIDAWLGGIAAKISLKPVIRTRHLSTPIRKGWNSRILYNWLANYTVTTCETVAQILREQARLSTDRCVSIPTGVNPGSLHYEGKEVSDFQERWGISSQDRVVGTTCVLRSWKGISDILAAAHILRNEPHLKWLIVGDGPGSTHYKRESEQLGVKDRVIFTGHLSNPYPAMASMDVFVLLSTANEGVSQASLQAAYLKKPLITTPIGGLPEVCLHEKTGYIVSTKSPAMVADRVLNLLQQPHLRVEMGRLGHQLVTERFTMDKTLDGMELIYQKIS